ncbi:MAG: zf-HC2 domain-containing protein [Acidiferrobacterales bacterium]
MLTCKEVSSLVSQSLDRQLSWYEHLQVRLHLFVCDACRRFARQMHFLRVVARRFQQTNPEGVATVPLSDAARRRIRQGLEQHN